MITFKEFCLVSESSTEPKTAVVVYGRFNPPTKAHMMLIRLLEKEAKKHNADAIVCPSHTQDKKKNPLTVEEKIGLLTQIVKPSTFVSPEGKTFKVFLHSLQQAGYTRVYQLAGSDRMSDFQRLVDMYNGKPDKQGNVPFQFEAYKLINAGDRDPDSKDDISGMSASKARKFASFGDFNGFRGCMPSAIDKATSKKVFDIIRSRLS